MNYPNLHPEFPMDMFAEVLGGIHAAVLATSATEAEHQ